MDKSKQNYIVYIITLLYLLDWNYRNGVSGSMCVPTISENINNQTEGNRVSFQCNPHNCDALSVSFQRETGGNWENACTYFTSNSSSMSYTLSNGVNYTGRAIIQSIGVYFFQLQHTMLEDNGRWRCFVTDGDMKQYPSEPDIMIINVNSNNLILNIDTPPSILLGTPATYGCRCDRVFPNVTVVWVLGGTKLYTGRTTYDRDDAVFSFESYNEFIFMDRPLPAIECLMQNDYGEPWSTNQTAEIPDNVNAPAWINGTHFSHPNPTPSSQLSMTCDVTGTNHRVSWIHNTFALDDKMMFIRNDTTIFGDFMFGETNATRSNVYWTVSPTEQSCSVLDSYNGVYKCRASAEEGDDQESDGHTVTVQYSPFFENPKNELIDSMIDEIQTLDCEVKCASPAGLTFTWTSENDRDGIDQNSSTIDIIVTEQDFDDNFTCTAYNSIGFVSKNFGFNQIFHPPTRPTEEITTEYPTTTSDSGNDTTSKPNNTALVIANAVIWSLCGVVAVVLVCLALYHYRQIQHGKKYQEEYSEELILTDDEAKPGTSHSPGDYDDISFANAGEATVGGVTNEGLYADVKTQIPVAPKRTSKIIASQPHPDTRTERTEAPTTPKSPINAQHQPNSPSAGRRPDPKADYTPVNRRKEIPPQHSNESNNGTASKVDKQQKRHDSPNKTAVLKQNTNGTKPSIPFKPNITSVRSSRSSAAGVPYDNAEVNLYANCDQRPVQKNADGTLTYADLDLQKEDPYNEGAPPVPSKSMNDREPVQYASIKHSN